MDVQITEVDAKLVADDGDDGIGGCPQAVDVVSELDASHPRRCERQLVEPVDALVVEESLSCLTRRGVTT